MRIRQRNAPEIKSWCVTFHSRTLQDRAIALGDEETRSPFLSVESDRL
ncbi:MAG: hypothetical protein V7L26_04775 [Nostoc sp.]|nr:hypothetical protein [Nostoc sp. LPT]MBN4003323.1 hypothetical protein [Nostoc sp. LPT]